ncbi:hypothetical protein VTN77DRAFT_1644 [Rasamsonia byssochlamydoides]|uniref:uncharacterized protein n=1 Tax=Rasamsonia byssochlamydoides TaxID=89139 RepID=UPI003742E9E3
MARLLQPLRRLLGLGLTLSPSTSTATFPKSYPRSIDTDFSVFREGDRVIVHGKNPLLTKPLTKGHRTEVRRGVLEHNDIIGKQAGDLVKAYKGPEYRLSHPTLEEYVLYTPRLVTPIYAADANLIVSLLDIHVTRPTEDDADQPPLEILEAGTGHGSLTLHLARAIHAANSNPPPLPERTQVRALQDRTIRPDAKDEEKAIEKVADGHEDDSTQKQWDAWRAQRRAVIHTVDVSAKFSAHAEKIVRGFRRGIYAGNVDFHVGHVEDWIADQVKRRQKAAGAGGWFLSARREGPTVEPFLSYAILDMPSAHLRIPHVAPVLRRDGILAVFMPSITQIGDCVQLIRQQRLPFIMERAVELGTGISSGRLWDVRMAVKKSRADPSSWVTNTSSPSSESPSTSSTSSDEEPPQETGSDTDDAPSTTEETTEKDNESVLVCRPKVGLRIVGGGFVGIWRRVEDAS